MGQIALPLRLGQVPGEGDGPARIVLGLANAHVADALQDTSAWPFRTAVLAGPPRSGKSLFARWFAASGLGDMVDDAHRMDETELFHRWNRAQADARPLLVVTGTQPWDIALPDLRSRLGGSLQLEIGQPDDAMAGELLLSIAAERGLMLEPDAVQYLLPRAERSAAALEALVEEIDRLSLERKAAPRLAIWRAALERLHGPDEPRLL